MHVHVYPLWSSSLVLEAVNTVEKEDTHESSVDPSMNFLSFSIVFSKSMDISLEAA